MQEQTLVRHCAPTLAGLKTGSLFNGGFADTQAMTVQLRRFNRALLSGGVRVIPLRRQARGGTLLYVFRLAFLTRDLRHPAALRLLRERGYTALSPTCCLRQLRHVLQNNAAFPHEIGLFLGYPPQDVRGFIEHRADTCRLSGCWKVYGDVDEARHLFNQYRACTRLYCALSAQGVPLNRLTAAKQ